MAEDPVVCVAGLLFSSLSCPIVGRVAQWLLNFLLLSLLTHTTQHNTQRLFPENQDVDVGGGRRQFIGHVCVPVSCGQVQDVSSLESLPSLLLHSPLLRSRPHHASLNTTNTKYSVSTPESWRSGLWAKVGCTPAGAHMTPLFNYLILFLVIFIFIFILTYSGFPRISPLMPPPWPLFPIFAHFSFSRSSPSPWEPAVHHDSRLWKSISAEAIVS